MLSKCFMYTLILLIINLPLSLAKASVGEDLKSFFGQLGASTNLTEGGAYKDQAAGYYAGGNFFARNRVHHAQLGHLQLPGYKAGCGGIDMHLGALSYISSEKLVQMMRSIGSSMASYGLMLALETMSPQVKNIISELNDLAQKVNMSNINSCKVAATALGSILPQSDAANHHLCTMIGNDGAYGAFSDYAAANQACGAGGRRRDVLKQGQNDPKFASMLGTEFNLAWKALQENNFLKANETLATFFMTLSGTLISKEVGEGYHIISKPSMASNDSLITALLYGGSTTAYKCQDAKNGCLDIVTDVITIDPSQALVSQVRTLLISIQNKILEDKELSKEEKGFLDATRLPFYKILNVLTAYRQGEAPLIISDYAELAAADVLYHYLMQILDVMEESLNHLKTAQVDESHLKRFEEGVRLAKNRIHQKRMGDFKGLEQVLNLVKKSELLEKSLMSKLGVLGEAGL